MKLIEQQEKNEKAHQARIEAQKKQAEQLSLNIAREFLPGLTIEAESTSVNESSVLPNIKQEPDSNTNRQASKSDEGAGREKPECSLQSDFDKAEQLSQATINFLKELTDLFMDKDVLLTMRRLKFMGKQIWSNDCNIEAFQKEIEANNKYERERAATDRQMQPSSHQVSRSLDFSHIGEDIKQEKNDDFNLPKVKKHFPGAKKASYEELQEQFQSRKRKSTPSPGRVPKLGFGSPPAKQAKIGENYKNMMDTKQKIIACGTEVLKKKKNAKNLDAIVHELDSMGREILQVPDYSFYHLMSYFDNKYSKLSDTTQSLQVKDDLFDFILSRVEYSRVRIIHYFLQSHNRFWGNVMFLHMSVILFASWHRSGQYACDSNTFLLKLQIIRNQCIFFCTYFQSLRMRKRYL